MRNRPQSEAERGDRRAPQDQIDPNEEANRPKAGDRPARQQDRAKCDADHAVENGEPLALDVQEKGEADVNNAGDDKIERHDQRDGFGAHRWARQKDDADDGEQNGPEEWMKNAVQ